MTHSLTRGKRFQGLDASDLSFGILTLFCLLLILKNSDVATQYIHNGLLLCSKTVIPSLFPFMVISDLIVASGIAQRLLSPLAPLWRRVLRLSETGGSCMLLGMLCGFPIGAKCAIRALDENRISRDEAERIIAMSSNPSSAFLISAVGLSLWGNKRFGLALYLSVLLSELITGFCMARTKSVKETPRSSAEAVSIPKSKSSPAELFVDAVTSSSTAMLHICAYVIFFAALVGVLGNFVSSLQIPDSASVFLFGFFELSGGMSRAASIGNPLIAALACAIIAGWSGISVHCQVMTLCGGRGLSFKPYVIAKAFQGVLCGVVTAGILRWFPSLMRPAEGIVTDAILVFMSMKDISVPALVTDGLFVAGWLISRAERVVRPR